MFEMERCFSLGCLGVVWQESRFILVALLIRAEYEREKQI